MGQMDYNIKEGKFKQITEKMRYKIEALYARGVSAREIGKEIGKDRRSVEREIQKGLTLQRNSDLTEKVVYLADVAQRVTEERAANKGRGLKIRNDHKLANYIETKIKDEKWSPDATIGKIRAEGLKFDTIICTKTLYNYIDKGIFVGISNKDLPVKKYGTKRAYNKIRRVALNNKDGKSITERPREATERLKEGHWEIDLVVGKRGTKPAILTLVDRKTRKSLYALVRNKTQEEVIAAIKRVKRRVVGDFSNVFKTITADNGSEFLNSKAIKEAADCEEIYYAHPYSSWERGSNENGNRILRRFIPKGTDIGNITEEELQRLEDWVNNYPRKILGYKTANQVAG